jgi:uncharacterized membrane protein
MSTYELLLFGHLLAAMVWVGGGVIVQMFYLRARVAGGEALTHFAKTVEWVGLRVTTPASLLVIIFGVLLVIELDAYDFGQFWIVAALAMFGISFATGAGFLGPETGRLGTLMDERPASDPEIARRIGRLVVISRIELTLLVLIVLDMVLKPGL